MTLKSIATRRSIPVVSFLVLIVAACAVYLQAQPAPIERTFPVPKSTVEKALRKLQPSMSGHLPTLDGFAQSGDRPLGRYQRGYYQCTAQVSATPSGGSIVRVTAKVTAWYADGSSPTRTGYQLLTSNGRLESDILDQLADELSSAGTGSALPVVASAPAASPSKASSNEPNLSAPEPRSGTTAPPQSTPQAVSTSETRGPMAGGAKPSGKQSDLETETASLEEVLRNQSRPKNIVAVKKSGTPVVGSPSLGGKTLFLASAHDEFEMLDFNDDWVHVRISGLSRGWIWRTNLEMPEGISDVPKTDRAATTASDLFQVSREETAPFPGDWAPLRGKTVKIISVQKVQENEKDSGAQAKLEFAKSILDKGYDELVKSPDLSGVVLIFDSADGGMIATTVGTIQRWKAGSLNDAAMWHQCYFDPPETFTISSAAPAAGR